MSISKADNASRFNNIPYEKLVSVTHAAAIAGLNPQTLYRLIKRNEIKVYGYPKTYRVNIDEILADRRLSYNFLGQPTTLTTVNANDETVINECDLNKVNGDENRIIGIRCKNLYQIRPPSGRIYTTCDFFGPLFATLYDFLKIFLDAVTVAC